MSTYHLSPIMMDSYEILSTDNREHIPPSSSSNFSGYKIVLRK
jgi:hypothetical protein